MKKLAAILLPFICLAFVSPSQAQTITVGSLDGTRSRAPLATGSGELSSARLRAALQSPTNFGPNGLVRCSVVVASGTPVITSAYLADKNVLFTSVFTGDLSASEAAAVRAFVARGGCIIADGNSDVSEQTAATSVVAAAGSLATIGPELACPNLSNGGAITGTPNLITNGPFGNVTGASWEPRSPRQFISMVERSRWSGARGVLWCARSSQGAPYLQVPDLSCLEATRPFSTSLPAPRSSCSTRTI
jgi:hypothetical protein